MPSLGWFRFGIYIPTNTQWLQWDPRPGECHPLVSALTIQTFGLCRAQKKEEKSRTTYGCSSVTSKPLRSTSLSSYVHRRSQRHHIDWSTSHLTSLQEERGFALNNTMCGQAHDKELVFEVAITKTPLSPLRTVYNHETQLWSSLRAWNYTAEP